MKGRAGETGILGWVTERASLRQWYLSKDFKGSELGTDTPGVSIPGRRREREGPEVEASLCVQEAHGQRVELNV